MKTRNINYTHRPNSGAGIAIPAILLLAAIAAIVALGSGCETRTAQPAAKPSSTPRPRETPKPQVNQVERVKYAVRPCTEAAGDPAGSPDWFDEELRRIGLGLDESQKAPEERGRSATR